MSSIEPGRPDRQREWTPSRKTLNLGKAALLSLAYLTEGFVIASATYLGLSHLAHVDDNTSLTVGLITGMGSAWLTSKLTLNRSLR